MKAWILIAKWNDAEYSVPELIQDVFLDEQEAIKQMEYINSRIAGESIVYLHEMNVTERADC